VRPALDLGSQSAVRAKSKGASVVEVRIEEMLARTAVDRKITNEPLSSKQKKEAERERKRKTQLGEKKEVRSKRV
jgi:hypothetical protein